MKIFLVIASIVVLVTGWPPSAPAKEWRSKKSTPSPVADTSDKISVVHLASITINIYATHSAKEYRVTPATKITVNGQPVQLNGLATGMNVVVVPAADGVTAANIDAKTPKR